MNGGRWLDPVDPGSSTVLDLLVDAARTAEPAVVDDPSLTLARFPGPFLRAALSLELELAAQNISVLQRHRLTDWMAGEGLPNGQRAVVFDVWAADATVSLVARGTAQAAQLPPSSLQASPQLPSPHLPSRFLPSRVAVVERGDDVLLLMPRRHAAAVPSATPWTDRLRQCIENTVRAATPPAFAAGLQGSA